MSDGVGQSTVSAVGQSVSRLDLVGATDTSGRATADGVEYGRLM